MHNLKRIGLVSVLLLLAAAILAFMLENQQSVSLFFLGWEGPQLPVAIYVSLALLCGVAIGPFLIVIQRLLKGRRRSM
jgi:uncharacterized integral membrane protein